jgi:7-keto-8-aminopelargonate synthetase-like enzyme
LTDLFDRCQDFLEDRRIVGPEDRSLAEKVLFGVSPVDNAGPRFILGGETFLTFGTNDYLGLSTHPEVRKAAAETAARHGIGVPMGARPLSGTCEMHLELERRVATFKRTPAAVCFTMGAGAMMGALACLLRPRDLAIFDEYSHASLVCGAKIAGATLKFFPHNDLAALERTLAEADPGGAKLIVVDGVYSMRGDIAPLREICNLKDCHGARLFVDDAHGNGVCGTSGRGVAEEAGVESRVDLHGGTFSKAFGTSGGFVAGDPAVVFYIRCQAPTMLFTKAPSAVVTAATLVSLAILEQAGDRRARLWENTRIIQGLLRDRGFDLGTTCTPITPVKFRGRGALAVAHALREKHRIFVPPVLFPAVPRGGTILRIIATALHEHADLARLADALETTCRDLGLDHRLRASAPAAG